MEQAPDGVPRYGESETKRLTVEAAEELLWVPQQYLDKGWFLPTDYSGSDPSVVQSARTSYGKGTTKVSVDKHLVRYLLRQRHTTPSEAVEVQAEMKTPLFVWPRQGGRHRTMDKESVLGWYPVLQDFYEIPTDEICEQSLKNRQGRGSRLDLRVENLIRAGLKFTTELDEWADQELTEQGIPLEVRNALRGPGYYTRGTIKTDLHNGLNFLSLRNDPHSQKEIRVNAQQWENFIEAVAPWTIEAFRDYRRNAISFSGPDLPLIGRMIEEGLREIPFEWYKEVGWTVKDAETGNPKRGRAATELDGKVEMLAEFIKANKKQ